MAIISSDASFRLTVALIFCRVIKVHEDVDKSKKKKHEWVDKRWCQIELETIVQDGQLHITLSSPKSICCACNPTGQTKIITVVVKAAVRLYLKAVEL